MDRERWLRVEILFHAATRTPPELRSSFLREATEDVLIRAEVERLLRADAAAGSRIDATVHGALRRFADALRPPDGPAQR